MAKSNSQFLVFTGHALLMQYLTQLVFLFSVILHFFFHLDLKFYSYLIGCFLWVLFAEFSSFPIFYCWNILSLCLLFSSLNNTSILCTISCLMVYIHLYLNTDMPVTLRLHVQSSRLKYSTIYSICLLTYLINFSNIVYTN